MCKYFNDSKICGIATQDGVNMYVAVMDMTSETFSD